MQSTEALERSINSVRDLQSIVSTMKALAATNITQYEKAVKALKEYNRTVMLGLRIVLANTSIRSSLEDLKDGTKSMIVAFGSDHGLAGRFNQQIVEYILEKEDGIDSKNVYLFCVGGQVLTRLESIKKPARSFTVPDTVSGITRSVQDILLGINHLRESAEGIDRVRLYYNVPAKGAAYEPVWERLIPADLEKYHEKSFDWNSNTLPTFKMDETKLLSSLLGNYFFVKLYRAFALSLAAENASRLSSMQRAERNIKDRLDELQNSYRKKRQMSITEELSDIVSGFKALRK